MQCDCGGTLNVARLRASVRDTCAAPAKLMGLFPRKGTIAVRSDADIVVWNPNRPYTISAAPHFMRVDCNPYEGMTPTSVQFDFKLILAQVRRETYVLES